MCRQLLEEGAVLNISDPKVSEKQIFFDLNTSCNVTNEPDPYVCCAGTHAVAILTEWDCFKNLDWVRIYNTMQKPAFVFDGRGILDPHDMRKIGFEIFIIGEATTS